MSKSKEKCNLDITLILKYVLVTLVVIYVIIPFICECFGYNKSKSKSKSGVIIEYYHNPGCPHCRNFMNVWGIFSSSVPSGVSTKQIDCSQDRLSCANVRGVPHVVFIKDGKETVYSGERTVEALNKFLANL